MNDINVTTQDVDKLKNTVLAVYILQACNFLLPVITPIVGVILNYIRRREAEGTWLRSHFSWQIKTFWYGLLWSVVSLILTLVFIGFLLLPIVAIWYIYRIVIGFLYLNEEKPFYVKKQKKDEELENSA